MLVDLTIEVKPLEFVADPIGSGQKFKSMTPFGLFVICPADPYRWKWRFTSAEGVLVEESKSSYLSAEQACAQANRWWKERIGPLVQLKAGLKHA